MGQLFGGRVLREEMKSLENRLVDYYGALNMISMGVNQQLPEKPEFLVRVEQLEQLNTNFVDGGLFDQPYILMEMLAVVLRVRALMDAIRRRQAESSAGANNEQTGLSGSG